MIEDNLALPVELLGSSGRYALYRCYSDLGELLYVGVSGLLGKRFTDHVGKLWFVQVRGITLEWYADELEVLAAERRAIHVEHPKYNKVHRQTTSIQVARPKTRRRPRTPITAAQRQDDAAASRGKALEIYLANPKISGKDLGAAVGLGERWGQLRKNEFAAAAPKGQDPQP